MFSECFSKFHGKHKQKGRPLYFFKVMVGDFAHKLLIPSAFIPMLRNETDENMVLQGPDRQLWPVKLWGTNTHLEFRQGWEKFVLFHAIEFGDFLVFKYVCSSLFKVMIFGKSGCEKNTAVFHLKYSEDLHKRCPATGSELPNDLISEEEKHDEADAVEENQGKNPKTSSSQDFDVGRPGPCQPSLAGKKHKRVKSAKSKEKSSQIQSHVVSGRRPVTQTERDEALKAASSFRSNRRFCSVTMQSYHVYKGFFLNLLKTCRCLQLPKQRTFGTLVDPNSKEWRVQYIWARDRAALSGGWKHFSIENKLEEGDVCVFERVDNCRNTFKLRVHIFRVVKECTPYKVMKGGQINGRAVKDYSVTSSATLKSFDELMGRKLPIDLDSDDNKNDQEEMVAENQGKEHKPFSYGHIFRVVNDCTLHKKMEGKRMNNIISVPTNCCNKKMRVSREDFSINLSEKAIEPEQGKDAVQRIELVRGKKDRFSSGGNFIKLAKSRCKSSIQNSIGRDTRVQSKGTTCLDYVNGKEDLCFISDSDDASYAKSTRNEALKASQELIPKEPPVTRSLVPELAEATLVVDLSLGEATSLVI